MNFVSLADLHRDIARWERQLPFFDAVCGVPRSGLLPATYLALRRNIRLVDFSDLLRQPEGAIERAPLRGNNPASERPVGNRLLLVDDSSSNDSVTFNDLRARLAGTPLDITYGAVYRASAASKVDCFYREVTMPRIFEWNWHRNWWIQSAMLDMDGVICEDWTKHWEHDVDPEFEQHVAEVPPLYLPQVPIRAVVTSRLEKYRKGTEQWLKRHGVQYARLIMHPAAHPDIRRAAGDYAVRKAAAYSRDPTAYLFVESSIKQATEIHRRTKKPVLCIDTMTMLP